MIVLNGSFNFLAAHRPDDSVRILEGGDKKQRFSGAPK
jgi:hypothetical protein